MIYCGPPEEPGNDTGISIVTGHHYNSRVQWKCNEGYDLLGNSSAVCTEDGIWDSSAPICTPIPTTESKSDLFS